MMIFASGTSIQAQFARENRKFASIPAISEALLRIPLRLLLPTLATYGRRIVASAAAMLACQTILLVLVQPLFTCPHLGQLRLDAGQPRLEVFLVHLGSDNSQSWAFPNKEYSTSHRAYLDKAGGFFR